MRLLFRTVVATFVTYFVAWTFWYTLFLWPDYRFYLEYLTLAWTGGGLETPTFIQWFSMVTTVVVLLAIAGAVFVMKKKKQWGLEC